MTDTPQTRIGPARYELIDKYGRSNGIYETASDAAFMAAHLWPEQSQDPCRTGRGYDIQVVGSR